MDASSSPSGMELLRPQLSGLPTSSPHNAGIDVLPEASAGIGDAGHHSVMSLYAEAACDDDVHGSDGKDQAL